ncbi:MAG: hypothetical protein U1F43_22235 [Myxococcota bacterium]
MIAWACAAALALGASQDPDAPLIDATPPARAKTLSLGGRALLLGAADVSREPDEDALETVLGLELAATWEPSSLVELHLTGRVRHHLGLTPHRARGGLEPELREARLLARVSAELDVEAGLLADLRWSTLVDPQPPDLQLGPWPASGEPGDRRRPIPALRAALRLGGWRFEALWQPLFVAPRVPLRGSDWAPLPAIDAPAGVDALADLPHARGLAGSVVGARATWRKDAWEAGLSWLWRWDPIPRANGFERQHVVGVDLATVTGPLHWRLEAACQDAHTAWSPALAATRRPAFEALLGVAAAPAIFLDGELTLRAVHLFGAGSERRLGQGPDDLDVGLRIGLLMAFDGVLRLDLEARRALLRDDGDVWLALAVRLGRSAEVALGLTLFGGDPMDAGRGALYDADDQLWARVVLGL